MKVMRMPVIIAAGAAAAAVLVAVPAGAGELPAVTVSPSSGPIGTVVTVSGHHCEDGQVIVGILRPEDSEVGAGRPIVLDYISADEHGDWTKEFVIPASAPVPDGDGGMVDEDVLPGPGYEVGGLCSYDIEVDPDGEKGFEYVSADFEVTAASQPTSTTSTPPTTAPPVSTPPPATPITDEPPFTG